MSWPLRSFGMVVYATYGRDGLACAFCHKQLVLGVKK